MINIIIFLIQNCVYSVPSKCYKLINPPSEVINSIITDESIYSSSTPTQMMTYISESTTSLSNIQTATTVTTAAIATAIATATTATTEVNVTQIPIQTEVITSTITLSTTSIQSIQTPDFVSNVNKNIILDLHNNERVLKNVTNSLGWSNSLELSANVLSRDLSNRGCILEHKLGSGVFGQNLYASYGTVNPNFRNAVNAWIDEKNLLNKPNVTFSEIGHYLIMVSSRYNNVGCSTSINYDKNCYVITCDYS